MYYETQSYRKTGFLLEEIECLEMDLVSHLWIFIGIDLTFGGIGSNNSFFYGYKYGPFRILDPFGYDRWNWSNGYGWTDTMEI